MRTKQSSLELLTFQATLFILFYRQQLFVDVRLKKLVRLADAVNTGQLINV